MEANLLNEEGIKLLTKKEAANELRVCYRTIERWYNKGYIRRIQIGGKIFFSAHEIRRVLEQSYVGQLNQQVHPSNTVGGIIEKYSNRISQLR